MDLNSFLTTENGVYATIVIVTLLMVFLLYKKIRKKYMIHKDYDRKLNEDDLKIRKDLADLRKKLSDSNDPNIKNEILNKINIIVKDKK